jgi:uncharacterized iron-regulated membrane protein
MSFLLVVRRIHLYLGLFLLPWVIMFAVSSIPINHTYAADPPKWTTRADVPFAALVPSPGEDLHPLGRQMMEAAGVSGGFFVNRPNPRQINVNHPNFFHPTRVFYYIDQKRLLAEDREFVFRQFITGMHTRGGYNLGGFWDVVWAVFVDIASVALVLWIISGLIMWWKLPGTGLRRWGWLAIAGGLISFAAIISTL